MKYLKSISTTIYLEINTMWLPKKFWHNRCASQVCPDLGSQLPNWSCWTFALPIPNRQKMKSRTLHSGRPFGAVYTHNWTTFTSKKISKAWLYKMLIAWAITNKAIQADSCMLLLLSFIMDSETSASTPNAELIERILCCWRDATQGTAADVWL